MKSLRQIQKFLIICAGYDSEIAEKCTSSEITKITTLGTLVVIPAILGFFSAFIAVWLTSHNVFISLMGGMVWSAIIFFVDRAIVSYGRSKKIDLIFFGRLCMAIVIAFTISMFLEIAIFYDAIREQQQVELIEMHDQTNTKFNSQIILLQSKLSKAKERLDEKEDDFLNELDGSGGTHKRGAGPVYQEKKDAYEKEQALYNEEKGRVAGAIERLEALIEEEVSLIDSTYAEGILGSLRALFSIEDPIVKWATWLIRLLLLFIELIPILIKITPTGDIGVYHKIVDMNDRNQISIQELTNKDYLAVLEEEAKFRYKVRLLEIYREQSGALLFSGEENLKLFNNKIMDYTKMRISLSKRIHDLVKDPVESQILLDQLNSLFDDLIDTVETLAQRSKGFHISNMPG